MVSNDPAGVKDDSGVAKENRLASLGQPSLESNQPTSAVGLTAVVSHFTPLVANKCNFMREASY